MDDAVAGQSLETLKERVGKLADQLEAEPLELILLNEFVEVDGEELKRDANVIAEDEAVMEVDDVHLIVLVLLLEMLQDLDFFLSLPVKARLIPHHFERHVDVVLVVVSLDHLPEAALANDFEHFVAVGDVVVDDVDVRVLLVVVARIVRRHDWSFLRHGPNEVDVWIVEDLLAFVRCEYIVEVLDHLFRLPRLSLGFRNHSIASSVTLGRCRRRGALVLLGWWTVTRHF